jgi:hypothetical protein
MDPWSQIYSASVFFDLIYSLSRLSEEEMSRSPAGAGGGGVHPGRAN